MNVEEKNHYTASEGEEHTKEEVEEEKITKEEVEEEKITKEEVEEEEITKEEVKEEGKGLFKKLFSFDVILLQS